MTLRSRVLRERACVDEACSSGTTRAALQQTYSDYSGEQRRQRANSRAPCVHEPHQSSDASQIAPARVRSARPERFAAAKSELAPAVIAGVELAVILV